jgi:hypothetical protein
MCIIIKKAEKQGLSRTLPEDIFGSSYAPKVVAKA